MPGEQQIDIIKRVLNVSELHVSYGYTCQNYTFPMDTHVRITRVLWVHVSELHVSYGYTCQNYTRCVTDVSSQSFHQVQDVPCTYLTVCQEPHTITVTPSALVNRWQSRKIFHNYQENICCRWTPWTAAVVRAARPSVGWCSSQFAPKIRSLSTPISARLNVLESRTL